MKPVELSSWEEFESKISALFEKVEAKKRKLKTYISDPLFRGHGNADWNLETTLERFTSRRFDMKRYCNCIRAVQPAIASLTGRTWDVGDSGDQSEQGFPKPPPGYEFMVYLRHHGFPSPLLDWTRSHYIAAFFAFRSSESQPGANVAMYSYLEWYGAGKIHRGGEPEIVGCGPYVTTHPRHFTQQCEYTFCKKLEEDRYAYWNHEEAFRRDDPQQDVLTKYILPGSERKKVLEKLETMNINAYSLFKNEESLMEWLAYREIERTNS